MDSGQANSQNVMASSDQFQVMLHNIPAPASGTSYYVWLQPDSSQGEAAPIPLGALQINHGVASLAHPYTDPQRHNLLAVAGSILITEESASSQPLAPSSDKSTWRYYAAFSQTPNPEDPEHFSLLDHLRHLLVEEPDLQKLGLNGGLNFWFLRNIDEVWKWSREGIDHNQINDMRAKIVNMLYYLHGLCTSQDLSSAAPGTWTQADNQDIASTKVPLLDCAQTPMPDALGYMRHIIKHLNGVINSPGVTVNQVALATQIIQEVSDVNAKLERILQDAQQLVKLNDAQFHASPLLNDIALQASEAAQGWLDPGTGTMHPGANIIYSQIENLASFSLMPYPSQH